MKKKKPIPVYRKKGLRGVTTRDYIGGMKSKKPLRSAVRRKKRPRR